MDGDVKHFEGSYENTAGLGELKNLIKPKFASWEISKSGLVYI